jgi:dTDP-4-dehydrorhamnose reductase
MRKKIFMAGVGGMLGEAFYDVFKENYELSCTDLIDDEHWISKLDFRDYVEYRRQVTEFNPDYLFHIGAHTSLEFCELNQDDAYKTNTLSVEYAVQIANELGIPLLFISTAGIFDGNKELYDDWDIPNPLGVYARSKYLAENFVERRANEYLICRAGWMMGSGPKKDKKFIQKLMGQIKNGKTKLQIVDDKDGTPTYTIDFAKNCKLLIESKKFGLYNLVCGGETSRHEVAEYLVSLLKLDIEIEKVDSSFFQEEFFAQRPPNERLLNYKLDLLGLNQMRDWREALEEYLDKYYKGYLDS